MFTKGKLIPNYLLCWTRVYGMLIKYIKICYYCFDCGTEVPREKKKCCENVKMVYRLTLIVKDFEDDIQVYVNNAEIIRTILNISTENWSLIGECLSIIRTYIYSKDNKQVIFICHN